MLDDNASDDPSGPLIRCGHPSTAHIATHEQYQFMTLDRYHLFGLNVDSGIPLPNLTPTSGVGHPDVVIGYGAIPHPTEPEGIDLYLAPHGAVLNVPKVARYLIRDGADILVAPAAAAAERNVRLYLLGSAFGAILHQRRLLPLHANVIDFGGAAVAFMGHSGAGKSTLANWFHDRGLPILGDDVCVVHNDDSGRPVAEPGLPRIRLWGDALKASGRDASDYEASFDDMDKYDVPIAAVHSSKPLPLAAIYNLRAAEPGQLSSITRLTGIAAIHALVANTYRGGYLPLMGGVEHHLAQCVALARQVPVFDLQRQWGLEMFAAEAATVETHARDVLRGVGR